MWFSSLNPFLSHRMHVRGEQEQHIKSVLVTKCFLSKQISNEKQLQLCNSSNENNNIIMS